MIKIIAPPRRVRELKREKNFYGFWELETRFGAVKLKPTREVEKERQEQNQIDLEFLDELGIDYRIKPK